MTVERAEPSTDTLPAAGGSLKLREVQPHSPSLRAQRSNPESLHGGSLDCVVASLLAMTVERAEPSTDALPAAGGLLKLREVPPHSPSLRAQRGNPEFLLGGSL